MYPFAILLVRVVALYFFANGIQAMTGFVFSLVYMKGHSPELLSAVVISLSLLPFIISVLLWIFAPVLARYTGVHQSEINAEPCESHLNHHIVAGGTFVIGLFLVVFHSIPLGVSLINILNPEPFMGEVVALWWPVMAEAVYVILGVVLMMSVVRIQSLYLWMRGRGSL